MITGLPIPKSLLVFVCGVCVVVACSSLASSNACLMLRLFNCVTMSSISWSLLMCLLFFGNQKIMLESTLYSRRPKLEFRIDAHKIR